jgi:hypothetical protein
MNIHYQVGGSLPADASSYIRRQADFDFYEGLLIGEFCYVLAPQHTGKSSLRVQAMRRLQLSGIACITLNLSKFSSQVVTAQQWYAGIIHSLVIGFNLVGKINLREWWQQRASVSPVQRFHEFIEQVLLVEVSQKIVIFIDEIENTLNLKFQVHDFFTALETCYARREKNYRYKRLNFAILGVADPSDLIGTENCSLFQKGRCIQPTPFQLKESFPLSQGLAGKVSNPKLVLQEILNWTAGQPLLTQKLCHLVSTSNAFISEGQESSAIAQFVQLKILENWQTQDESVHFKTIYTHLYHQKSRTLQRLTLYRQILRNRRLPGNQSLEQRELLLSGLVTEKQGILQVSNRIYEAIFNDNWLEKSLRKLQLSQKPLKYSGQNNQKDFHEMTETLGGKEEQILYEHFLSLAQKESPSELISRFRQLFILGYNYPDIQVFEALDKILNSNCTEREFHYILNRCCHILINRWQLEAHRKFVAELVSVLHTPVLSSKPFGFRSTSLQRLQYLVSLFIKTEEYLTLKRLVHVVEQSSQENQKEINPALGRLICRYPYLYNHCLLTQNTSYEHQQTIRNIQSQKQWQFEINLSQYVTYLVRRSQLFSEGVKSASERIIYPVQNPTLLTDRELHTALKQFVGKVEGSYSYQELARVFLMHTSQIQSYRAFKDDLYEYLIASVEADYGKRRFNERLYQHIKSTFPEKDDQKVSDFLIMRTCSHLFNFLVVESPQNLNHYIFIDLISNLGPMRTIGLLLKIVLLSRQVKCYLEKRFSILFDHYESQAINEILWFVKSLESLNVALVVNFGSIDLSLLQQNLL